MRIFLKKYLKICWWTGCVLIFGSCHRHGDTLFVEVSPQKSGVYFINDLPEQTSDGMNIIQYLYYYNGGGVAAGDVDNDGRTDLFFTSNLGENRLFRNVGAKHSGDICFEDITQQAQVAGSGSWKSGVVMADVNGDGWLDIYVCQVGKYKQFSGRNQLFINQKNGTFLEQATRYGLDFQGFSTQAAFFDFDLDGDLDCFLLNHSVHSPENYQPALSTRQFDPLASDRFFRNDGDRTDVAGNPLPIFTDITPASGLRDGKSGYGLGITIGDVNTDGYPDIFVGNDFHENDFLYLNQRGQFFEEVAATRLGHCSNFSMGCDLADLDNDGFPEILSLDMKPEPEPILKASAPADAFQIYLFKHSYGYHWQFPRNQLHWHLRDSAAHFAEIGQLAGIAATDWSWSGLLADLDLDGWRDIFITNGIPHRPNDNDYNKFIGTEHVQRTASDLDLVQKMPDGRAKNYAFRNLRHLNFENVSEKWGLDFEGFSNGAVFADFDNDGDLDLATNNLRAPASIFENKSKGKKWLKIQLKGKGKNTAALGAKMWVTTSEITQYFENQTVKGFQSSVESGWTLGLGTDSVAKIVVRWTDGSTSQHSANAGQSLILDENTIIKNKTSLPTSNDFLFPKKLIFKWIADDSLHHQHALKVFNRDKLLPWVGNFPQFSVEKPPATHHFLADFDADGHMDSAVVGEWLPMMIFFQEKNGSFSKVEIPHSLGLWRCLVAADFDGDGKIDLAAGNFGNNSNLAATPAEPLGWWVRDFDNNGTFDPILTYYRQGKNYVFADKDLIVSQLPMLKKKYVRYREYANSTFKEVFTKEMLEGAAHSRVEMLSSCWFKNLGNRQFQMLPLPRAVQISTVEALLPADFDADGSMDLLLGGNFLEIIPAIGRQDGSFGTLLTFKNGDFQVVSNNVFGQRVAVQGFQWLQNEQTIEVFGSKIK